MTEEMILNWALFAGIIASFGAIVKIIYDNRTLSNGQKDIKNQSQLLKDELDRDHQTILSKQDKANLSLATLDTRVEYIKGSIEESNRRLESLNGSEKEARQAADSVVRFIEKTQERRLRAEQQYRQLLTQVQQLESQVEQLKEENRNLAQQLNQLKPPTRQLHRDRGHSDRGMSL